MKKFRYDYKNKMSIIMFIVSCFFIIMSIISYKQNKLGLFVFLLLIDLLSVWYFCCMIMQGIWINFKKRTIVIYDAVFFIKKINVDDILFVELKQVPKEKRSKWYLFLGIENRLFVDSETEYVYNQGKNFKIYFHLKNGNEVISCFSWLYKEKAKKVMKTETKLVQFIDEINNYVKKQIKKR